MGYSEYLLVQAVEDVEALLENGEALEWDWLRDAYADLGKILDKQPREDAA